MTRVAATPALLSKLAPLANELADNDLILSEQAAGLAGAHPNSGSTEPACQLIEPAQLAALCSAVQTAPAVVIADPGSIPEAVACIQQGAADYLTAPVTADALAAAVERAMAQWSAQRPFTDRSAVHFEIVGESPAMHELLNHLDQVSRADTAVLLVGEPGTGQDLIAQALHAMGPRRAQRLRTLNCATMPAHLLEAELFGLAAADGGARRQGLFEAAQGATLFLDNVTQLPEEAQAKLQKMLASGTLRPPGTSERLTIDVRLITASHQPLDSLAEKGQFHAGLLPYLGAAPVFVPPLRERGEDVLQLAERFLSRTSKRLHKAPLRFSNAAITALRDYQWPGNVRELENAVERAVIVCNGSEVAASELAIETPESRNAHLSGLSPAGTAAAQSAQSEASDPAIDPTNTTEGAIGLGPVADDGTANIAARSAGSRSGAKPAGEDNASLETYFVNFVLEHQDQLTETELAERLGISRKSLWERRQRLNIPRKRTRKRGPRRDRA